MKIIYTTAAQGLLLLAACLPAAAQAEINPDHSSDETPVQISAAAQEPQIQTLQAQLEACQGELAAKAARVEEARKEAVSAGIQGDGAATFIDAYQQEQKEMEVLLAALNPKMEQTRELIASLNKPVSPAVPSVHRDDKPAQPAISVASKSQQRKQTEPQIIARHDSSKVNPVGR